MPSILLCDANHVNQKLNNIQLPIFPIQWSPIQRQWILCNNEKVTNYLMFSFVWKFSAVVIFTLALILAAKNPTLVQIEQIFVCVVSLQVVWATVITDLILILFGAEMVGCCNWCYKAENDWSRHSMDLWLSLKYIKTTYNCSWHLRKGKNQ